MLSAKKFGFSLSNEQIINLGFICLMDKIWIKLGQNQDKRTWTGLQVADALKAVLRIWGWISLDVALYQDKAAIWRALAMD